MTTDGAPEAAPLDARVARSRRRILEATYELLTENGLAGVSIDDIARRSGVAKTTIYRHWSDRSSLLLEACSSIAPAPTAPDTGHLASDLRALLRTVRDELQKPWATVYPSIIDAAERDPLVSSLQTLVHQRYAAPFQDVLLRARDRGEFAASTGTDHIVALLLGHLYYRRWFSREPLDDGDLEQLAHIVELVLAEGAIR